MADSRLFLPTKLQPPRLAYKAISRGALLARFGSFSGGRVPLLSAPAGYGKTTTVHQWLQTEGLIYAWLSLDEHDDSLTAFLNHLIAALNQAVPAAGLRAAAVLESSTIPQPVPLADAFLAALANLWTSLAMVLDRYHQDVSHAATRRRWPSGGRLFAHRVAG